MTNDTHENNLFDIKKCRAKPRGAGKLIDCLSWTQAGICNFSLSFGKGYFCKHPLSHKIINYTEKIKSDPDTKIDIIASDD